jgi:Phosphodiester glycosidase
MTSSGHNAAWRLALAGLAGVAACGVLAAGGAGAAELPLGSRSLDERRERVTVAPGVRWTVIVREGGPWRVNVLTIDRVAAPGVLSGLLSNNRVAGLERPSAMARRTTAIAGVNGGFFAAVGDPVGALAIDGRLLSEPVDGRSALVVPSDPSAAIRVMSTEFEGSVRAGEATRILDGVERRRGLVPACGGRGGDRPTQLPNSALTCTDRSELVLLSRRFGATAPSGGAEALLRGGGVTRVGRASGRRVPRGALLLSGSGNGAAFVERALPLDSRPEITMTLRAGGEPLALGAQALVTGGGPRLLTRGRVSVTARSEGFAPLEAPSFFGSFVASRQPRTLAGVRADGRLVLVTVDGRRPGWSAGVTLSEAARLMRSLGARDALNLDGGGSTAMVIRGELVSRPSDPSGERAVSDGIFLLP